MQSRHVSMDEMRSRVAIFSEMTPSARPLIDAVLPQFEREIYTIIGGGVLEDPDIQVPIKAVEGFHLSVVKAGPGKGTGLHNHETVEVFMPLTGRWTVMWNDDGGSSLTLGPHDVASIPAGVMRGFRNESDETALLLVVVGGTEPGRVDWTPEVVKAAAAKGFHRDAGGVLVESAAR